MFLAIYIGPEVGLGRFGTVKPGQELRLTPVETRCIRQDKRFKVRSEVIATREERRMELSEMGHSELYEMATEARQAGRPIEFNGRYSKTQFIHAITAMERLEEQHKANAAAEAAALKEANATLRAMTGK